MYFYYISQVTLISTILNTNILEDIPSNFVNNFN